MLGTTRKRSTSCSPASTSAPTSATPPGTPALAGARQAALGLRGIALSAPATDREQPSFELLKPWAASVLEMLFDVARTCRSSTSISRPAAPSDALDLPVDAALRRQGRSLKDPMGRQIYWYTVVPVESDRRGVRPLGVRPRLRFDHAAAPRSHRPRALERVRQLEAWEVERVGPVVRIGISGWRYEPWRGVFYRKASPSAASSSSAAGTSRASRSTARSIRCSAPSTTRPGTARRRRVSSSA